MAIRYSENGEIETYNEETGKTTGHISTMGNMIEETEEDKKRNEKMWKEAMKKYGLRNSRKNKENRSVDTVKITPQMHWKQV